MGPIQFWIFRGVCDPGSAEYRVLAIPGVEERVTPSRICQSGSVLFCNVTRLVIALWSLIKPHMLVAAALAAAAEQAANTADQEAKIT